MKARPIKNKRSLGQKSEGELEEVEEVEEEWAVTGVVMVVLLSCGEEDEGGSTGWLADEDEDEDDETLVWPLTIFLFFIVMIASQRGNM